MDQRHGSTARAVITVVAAMFALLLMALPAYAGGGKSGDSAHTEDNDTNDGNTLNNVSDDGDNKHPSGKDRSVENGGSGNQGSSGSDPDGDSNGGPDKPNGSGGVDKADQDGNNGCGNDDDFEDDNNGNCGGKGKGKDKVKGSKTTEVCADLAAMPNSTVTCGLVGAGGQFTGETDVLGELIHKGDTDAVAGGSIGGVNSDVLGTRFARGATAPKAVDRGAPAAGGKVLPFTGATVLWLLAVALGLIGSGVMFWRRTHG